MRIAVVGLGTTGGHLARQLRAPDIARIDLHDRRAERADLVATAVEEANDGLFVVLAEPDPADPPDVMVLATPAGDHVETAEAMVRAGSHVVSVADDPEDVAGLLSLDGLATERGRSVVVGAGFSPGLSCLLVRFAADRLDAVDEISVAKAGTAGPTCARQHHRALKTNGRDWRDGSWELRRGGSGRDLAWFPDPIGARDCYRGALASPILLQRVFPTATRISARIAATRRDRFTSWLPMLRPPHQDGGPGAIRAEVRGRLDGAIETVVYGVMDHPSVGAGTVAAVAAIEAGLGHAPTGARGLAEWDHPGVLLSELHARGVKVAAFSGPVRSGGGMP